jgi:regulator of sigma E protease
MMHTENLIFLNGDILKKMLMGRVSLNTLSGPISVFQAAGEASGAGLSVYLGFIGFISVALGFVNLLPIPILDGGNVFFQIIELVRGRPLSMRSQLIGVKLGLFLLLCLMLQATINDVLHLI